jgi:hypothetical protein
VKVARTGVPGIFDDTSIIGARGIGQLMRFAGARGAHHIISDDFCRQGTLQVLRHRAGNGAGGYLRVSLAGYRFIGCSVWERATTLMYNELPRTEASK